MLLLRQYDSLSHEIELGSKTAAVGESEVGEEVVSGEKNLWVGRQVAQCLAKQGENASTTILRRGTGRPKTVGRLKT
jgi:hypothetical protein